MSESAIKSEKLSPGEIADKARKRVETVGLHAEAPPVSEALPRSFPAFNWAKIGKDMTPEAFAGILCAKQGVFIPVKPLKVNNAAFSFSYSYKRVRVDRVAYTPFVSKQWAVPFMRRALTTVCCDGTRRGQVARLNERLKPPHPVQDKHLKIDYVLRHMPMAEFDFLNYMDLNKDNPIFKLNASSDAGLYFNIKLPLGAQTAVKVCDMYPSPVCTHLFYPPIGNKQRTCPTCEPVMDIGFRMAKGYLEKIKELSLKCSSVKDLPNALKEFMKDVTKHPEEFTAMFKRKLERIPIDEVNTKVRTYTVFPLALKLLFMYCIHPIKSSMQNFVSVSESNLCNDFSPHYGGASNLMNSIILHAAMAMMRFEQFKKSKVVFKGYAYGDDHIWIFFLSDGRILIMTPDVKSMDLSTSSKFGLYFATHFPGVFPNAPLWWVLLLTIWGAFAVSGRTHLDGVYEALRFSGLFSGIPGTTEMNMKTSVHIHGIISSVESQVQDLSEFLGRLADAMQQVRDNLGFDFKNGPEFMRSCKSDNSLDLLPTLFPDMCVVTDVEDLQKNGLNLPFLSMKIVVEDGKYLFVPYDMHKFGASLIHPRKILATEMAMETNRLERYKGIYYSGAWYDDDLAEYLISFVNNRGMHAEEAEFEPDTGFGQDDVSELTDFFRENHLFNDGRHLPPREFMVDFETLPKEEVHAKWKSFTPLVPSNTTESGPSSVVLSDVTAEDIMPSVF